MPNLKPGYTLTFGQLASIFAPLHQWHRGLVDDLHDVWKLGAPMPNTVILTPHGVHDERKQQAGVHIERVILPSQLAPWILRVANIRGMNITYETAMKVARGDFNALAIGLDAR